MKPRLSLITSCFNSEANLAALMDSVISQSHTPVEHILIDGASDDNTLGIIENYKLEYNRRGIELVWHSEPDNGIYDAWNKGLARATGDWISFVGSDDVLLDGALETMARMAETNPNADFLTAKSRILNIDGSSRIFGEPWAWNVFKREMKILHAGGWHRAGYFQRYGKFDDSYKIVGDYEMLLRAGKDLTVKFFDQIIVEMGGGGVSTTRVFESLNEARRAKLRNGSRNALMAVLDQYWVYFKIKLKYFVR